MASNQGTERLLTVAEVADLLHVHPNTLRRWSDEGKIVSYRITVRGDRRFQMGDVETFLTEMNPNKDSEARHKRSNKAESLS